MDDIDIDTAWSNFCDNDFSNGIEEMNAPDKFSTTKSSNEITSTSISPKCSQLNISTKTKIAYLNVSIDLKAVFWNVPLIKYHEPCEGFVKKQMKFNSTTLEEVDTILQLKSVYEQGQYYVDDYIISQIHKPDGRIKFKDIRKISIGICKKDITSYRCKRKSAFYNCFVVILRLLHNDVFKEIHIKVFNTGKLEIPGIQDSTILDKVLTILVKILTPLVVMVEETGLKKGGDEACETGACETGACETGACFIGGHSPLAFIENKSETVMINSNFNCGYYINREKMYNLLKYKYKINSNFDPCSYPGIQCEFYYDSLLVEQSGIQPAVDRSADASVNAQPVIKVSFMIFRTGSVLIVGKCTEELLYQIYHFLCDIFVKEYDEIKWNSNEPFATKIKDKVRKLRKKTVYNSV
jgi:hypothetical protein